MANILKLKNSQMSASLIFSTDLQLNDHFLLLVEKHTNAKQACQGKSSGNESIKIILFFFFFLPEYSLQSNMLHYHYLITVISTLAPSNVLKTF